MKQKLDKNSALRLLLYCAAAIISLILARVMGSVLLSVILCTVSVAFFTMMFSTVGIPAILPSLIPIIVICFSESVISALSSLTIVIIAASFGLSARKKLRPVETILIASAIFIVFSAALAVLEIIATNGNFSVKESLGNIVTILDKTLAGIAETYKTATGHTISNISYISSTLKSMLVGVVLSSYIAATSFYYMLTVLCAKLVRESSIYKGKKSFEILPSRISAWVFIVCAVISLVFAVNHADVRFYTHLPTNIIVVLSPLFIFAGIYYVFNVKYKVERTSPVFTIIVLVASLLFGLVQFIPLYFAFSGITYTLRYNTQHSITSKDDSQ